MTSEKKITCQHRYKTSQQNAYKLNLTVCTKIFYHDYVGFIARK